MNKKRILKTLSMLVMIFAIMLCIPITSEAKSAKSILNAAVKKMKQSSSYSFSYTSTTKYAGESETEYTKGFVISDNKIDYGIYNSNAEPKIGWEEYDYKGKIYTKSFGEKKYGSYTNPNINEVESNKTAKEYCLSHLKNIKLAGTSKSSYTITGKPNYSDTSYKKITVTISKKTGRITKIKFDLKKRTYKNIGSDGTFTVLSGNEIYSNICYGDATLSLPSELK